MRIPSLSATESAKSVSVLARGRKKLEPVNQKNTDRLLVAEI
jgi:hypothetical protein